LRLSRSHLLTPGVVARTVGIAPPRRRSLDMSVTRLGVAIACAATIASAGAGCPSDPEPCTPANAGLGAAPRVTPRTLPGRAATDAVPCNPHTEVIHSDADLRAMNARYGIAPAGTTDDAGAPVDFSKETVVVVEASFAKGISWTVVQGDVA